MLAAIFVKHLPCAKHRAGKSILEEVACSKGTGVTWEFPKGRKVRPRGKW